MGAIHVTRHAAIRYVERINSTMTHDQAVTAIERHSDAIRKAAAFKCRTVKLADGSRLVLDGLCVVTVLARRLHPWGVLTVRGRSAA